MRRWLTALNQQRGAAMIELLFALPIMVLLLLGGLMLGYYQFAKLALVWHAFDRTEDLAVHTSVMGVVDSAWGQIKRPTPAGLNKKAHSFSFAVPIPNRAFAFTLSCYPSPLSMPHFDFGQPPPPTGKRSAFDRLQGLIESVELYTHKAGSLVDRAEDVVDNVHLAAQLVAEFSSSREMARAQGIRMVTSWGAEELMALTCTEPGKAVIRVRAVAWSEQTKSYK